MSDYKGSKEKTYIEIFRSYNSSHSIKAFDGPILLDFLLNQLIDQIQKDDQKEVLVVLKHMQIEKSIYFTSKKLTKFFSEDDFNFIFFYCLSTNCDQISSISVDLLNTIIQKTKKFDHCFFSSQIIESFYNIFQKNDQEINNKIIQITSKLCRYSSIKCIIFWDLMKLASNNINELEFVSEFIYREIESFLTIEDFDFLELFEIMNNILTNNNQIANSNIMMSINKAIDLNSQEFIDFYINKSFLENLLNNIYHSQLKSVKKQSIILLTTFISKFCHVKEKTFEFPLLNYQTLLNLLNAEATNLLILRYLNSIIIFHPNELTYEKLPLDFDINFLFCELIEKHSTETSFNIKIETYVLISHLIGHDFIDKDLLLKNYPQIISILFELISVDFNDIEIFIEIFIKVCSDFLTSGITQDSIQELFIVNDSEIIFNECLEKHGDLTGHIQSLNNLIFN